jgi:hypothetical protein
VIPAEGTPRPGLAVAKVAGATAALLLAGALVYRAGLRRRGRAEADPAPPRDASR